MEKVEIFCTHCKGAIEDETAKCNNCGSDKKTIQIFAEDEIKLYDQIKLKSKGKIEGRKIFKEHIDGYESSANGNMVAKIRTIDNLNDVYFEEVKDLDGSVIHKSQEKLSEPKGHGSAKKKKAE